MPTDTHNSPSQPPTLTVSQLNRQVKQLLEGNFASVWVEGELSNFSRPSSGHWYFSLKDHSAQIRCAMFRGNNIRLRFSPQAGQQVMLRGRLSLYEARGDYQLIVEEMLPAGAGALAAAFEALKEKLRLEGLFDPARKQPLPDLPRHIAVVTSPTGAAIRDILTVLARRFPATMVTIIPVPVQGEAAAPAIARAIELANRAVAEGSFDFDVILAGRGGGSMEDLWAFNEEQVARAIAQSELPVVSAVGHEVDFTIADFVADVRAPTPSAAAELLTPDQREWQQSFSGYQQLLHRQLALKLATMKQQLGALQRRLRHPGARLQDHCQRLDELELRLRNSWRRQQASRRQQLALSQSSLQHLNPHQRIKHLKLQISELGRRLQKQAGRDLERKQQRLAAATQLLETVSPLATLNRGYSITRDKQGAVLRSSSALSAGELITTRLAEGQIVSRVESTEEF